MTGRESQPAAYARRAAVRTVVKKVGTAKLAAIALGAALVFILFLGLLATLAGADAEPGEAGAATCNVRQSSKKAPPAGLIPIYGAAAKKFHLGSRGASILAAINYVETDYGQSPLPGVKRGTTNSAGAAGPMQFLFPSSWEMYGVDGNGDGVADVYNATDAIFSAANLLHAEGAPRDWYHAIFAYNHADWYVRKVLRKAGSYGPLECEPSELGTLPSEKLQRVIYVARWIQSLREPYCWGGGHSAKPGPSPPISGGYCDNIQGERVYGSTDVGLDCSGSVRWLLVLTGYPDPGGISSGSFASAYLRGPGKHVTIWSNSDHVFVSIDGTDWGTSSSHFRHGPGFGYQPTSGFVASHPPGL
ncbi:MAG: lytic transglycosylase domain-containing protein [Solirubrobacterales bacterium]